MKKSFIVAVAAILSGIMPIQAGTLYDESNFTAEDGLPSGWQLYQKTDADRQVFVKSEGENKGICLIDKTSEEEIGVSKVFPAVPGNTYRLTVDAALLPESIEKATNGFNIQIRFLPSQKLVYQHLELKKENNSFTVEMKAPELTEQLAVYIYTWKIDKTAVRVTKIKLEEITAETPAK